MSATITITRAGPLTTIQDAGRFGMLRHGVSASGPMDRGGFALAGALVGAEHAGIEITTAGLDFIVAGSCSVGMAGGDFKVKLNGVRQAWPGVLDVASGDKVSITPGKTGNYGYLRFAAALEQTPVMGSVATSSRARLGGLSGRALQAGDVLRLRPPSGFATTSLPAAVAPSEGPIRVIWGLHADLFPAEVRDRFIQGRFAVTTRLDRMGVRLTDPAGVFVNSTSLTLVSDAIVPGDIQILGDGTPIVLMRDHQPTGGYPRIATIISADLDRFAQLRPGAPVAFAPVTVEHAHLLLRSRP